MGAGEITVIIILILSGTWLAAKIVGFVWRIVRAPVLSFVDYFFVITSSHEPVLDIPRTGSNGGFSGSRDLVPGQQHQVEPQEPDENEPDEKAFARQLAREELIITLAVQRKDNGDYLFSANEITKFVGGAAAPVKNTIANVRGRKEAPPPPRSIARPPGGWPAH